MAHINTASTTTTELDALFASIRADVVAIFRKAEPEKGFETLMVEVVKDEQFATAMHLVTGEVTTFLPGEVIFMGDAQASALREAFSTLDYVYDNDWE